MAGLLFVLVISLSSAQCALSNPSACTAIENQIVATFPSCSACNLTRELTRLVPIDADAFLREREARVVQLANQREIGCIGLYGTGFREAYLRRYCQVMVDYELFQAFGDMARVPTLSSAWFNTNTTALYRPACSSLSDCTVRMMLLAICFLLKVLFKERWTYLNANRFFMRLRWNLLRENRLISRIQCGTNDACVVQVASVRAALGRMGNNSLPPLDALASWIFQNTSSSFNNIAALRPLLESIFSGPILRLVNGDVIASWQRNVSSFEQQISQCPYVGCYANFADRLTQRIERCGLLCCKTSLI
jgi:hypothetical protein